MDQTYQIVQNDKPEPAAIGVIGQGIHTFNEAQGGDQHYQRLCFFLHGPDEAIVGGLIGATYWDWFYVDLLWVQEKLRGQGYGHQLLAQAEAAARRRGAKNAFLDTFSFQAPGFYQAHGYVVFGQLPDFPAGHTRYYMRKQL
jgi:GNAT superfamily N-acetyltransferase